MIGTFFFIILFKGLRNYYIDNCIIVSKNPHMAVQMQKQKEKRNKSSVKT